jgi:hypothetical protein
MKGTTQWLDGRSIADPPSVLCHNPEPHESFAIRLRPGQRVCAGYLHHHVVEQVFQLIAHTMLGHADISKIAIDFVGEGKVYLAIQGDVDHTMSNVTEEPQRVWASFVPWGCRFHGVQACPASLRSRSYTLPILSGPRVKVDALDRANIVRTRRSDISHNENMM